MLVDKESTNRGYPYTLSEFIEKTFSNSSHECIYDFKHVNLDKDLTDERDFNKIEKGYQLYLSWYNIDIKINDIMDRLKNSKISEEDAQKELDNLLK